MVAGSWLQARPEKGVVPLLEQVWISNGCQRGPSARWDHSRTTTAPTKSPACLPKEVSACGPWVVPPPPEFIFNLFF